MIQYLAAVAQSKSSALVLFGAFGFLIVCAFVGYVMYWSLHHHHADYDDNDWEG